MRLPWPLVPWPVARHIRVPPDQGKSPCDSTRSACLPVGDGSLRGVGGATQLSGEGELPL